MRMASFFWVTTLFLIVTAFYVQTTLPLSSDVGYLMYASQQLLRGGRYVFDIFETNPPMILYLYFPASFLVAITSLSVSQAVQGYVLFLSFVSSYLCYVLLQKLFSEKPLIITLYVAMLVIFCFLPGISFAQREHIFMILVMPYLLGAAIVLKGEELPAGIAIVIGLLAGLGFSIKPFFLIPLCFVEISFVIRKKNLFAWVRLESLVILLVMLLYLWSIFIWHAEYWNTILPLVLQYYFTGVSQSFVKLLLLPLTLFCMVVIFLSLIFYRFVYHRTFCSVMLLALVGMLLAFLIPCTPWFYHLIPALSLSVLLVTYFITEAIYYTSPPQQMMVLIATGFFLMFPLLYGTYFYRQMMNPERQSTQKQLANYINQQSKPRSLMCLSSTADCFPLIYMTGSQYAGRYPGLWWYRGLKKHDQSVVDRDYLIGTVIDDLNRYRATWVILNTQHLPYSILKDFSENPLFAEAFGHYRYVMTANKSLLFERI